MFSEIEIELDMLPIAALHVLEFCPRCFYYECIAHRTSRSTQELPEQRGDDAGAQREKTQLRRLWVRSSRFRVSGYATVIEDSEQGFIPVECRDGKMAEWLHAPIQLCAQAFCLEEMANGSLQYGYVCYNDGRQREKVLLSEMLRQQTEASIYYAFVLLQQERIPAPLVVRQKRRARVPSAHPKCRECIRQAHCLPREVLLLQRKRPHPLLKSGQTPFVMSPFQRASGVNGCEQGG